MNTSAVNCELQSVNEKRDFMEMAVRHFRELNPNFVAAPDWELCYFENIQRNPDCSLCWIIVDRQRAGFVLYGIEPHRFLPRKTGAVYELYVLPEYRGKGVGSACAELVIGELRKASPSKIQLEVIEGNDTAARLWRRLGFRRVSERLTMTLI